MTFRNAAGIRQLPAPVKGRERKFERKRFLLGIGMGEKVKAAVKCSNVHACSEASPLNLAGSIFRLLVWVARNGDGVAFLLCLASSVENPPFRNPLKPVQRKEVSRSNLTQSSLKVYYCTAAPL